MGTKNSLFFVDFKNINIAQCKSAPKKSYFTKTEIQDQKLENSQYFQFFGNNFLGAILHYALFIFLKSTKNNEFFDIAYVTVYFFGKKSHLNKGLF